MLTRENPSVRYRATILGALITGLLFLAAVLLAKGTYTAHVTSEVEVVLLCLRVGGACALVRLTLLCALTTKDVLTSPRDNPVPNREVQGRIYLRRQMAGWLLAAAGVFGSAASATAAPATTQAMIVADTHGSDPFLDLEKSLDQVHAPASRDMTPQHQGEAQKEFRQESICAPEPSWTLPSGNSALACRVLGGGTQTAMRTHTVQRGETLWGIAASYLPRAASSEHIAVHVQAWIKANPFLLNHPDLIEVGDVLTIPHN